MRGMALAVTVMAAGAGLAATGGAPTASAARLCPKWTAAEAVGSIDGRLIGEASGLEASARYKDRLYHHNDSGDDLRFFVTDRSGGDAKVVNLTGPRPRDIEDMSLGPCGAATCLYLGDIGDNPASRSEVSFTLVREKARFAGTERPRRTVRARYPDGAHNAEAFAVHPNGDLFVITKPADARMTRREPARVYRLKASQLRAGGSGEPQTFEKLGEIDLPALVPEGSVPDWIITAMDISADGRRVVALSYGAVYELAVDLAKGLPGAWVRDETFRVIRVKPLPQQESVAWTPDGRAILFNTEANTRPTAPLMRLRCEA